jgi:hypothetical protein
MSALKEMKAWRRANPGAKVGEVRDKAMDILSSYVKTPHESKTWSKLLGELVQRVEPNIAKRNSSEGWEHGTRNIYYTYTQKYLTQIGPNLFVSKKFMTNDRIAAKAAYNATRAKVAPKVAPKRAPKVAPKKPATSAASTNINTGFKHVSETKDRKVTFPIYYRPSRNAFLYFPPGGAKPLTGETLKKYISEDDQSKLRARHAA